MIDKDGNAVANTYTLNFSYGVGLVAEGTGILLNNELDDFAAKPGAPNAFGLIGYDANNGKLVPQLATAPHQVHAIGVSHEDYQVRHPRIHEAHPGLAKDIFETFSKAKNHHVSQLIGGQIAEPSKYDQTALKIAEITGKDPMPFGVEPSRAMIEAINQFATEQKIIPRPFKMEEIWAKGTLDLIG